VLPHAEIYDARSFLIFAVVGSRHAADGANAVAAIRYRTLKRDAAISSM
jgi:hypothetical protein